MAWQVIGMKSRWQSGGVASAKAAYHTLDLVIRHALEAVAEAVAATVSGGVQSDAAALLCPDAATAIAVGRLIFREAFRRSDVTQRYWVRVCGPLTVDRQPVCPCGRAVSIV